MTTRSQTADQASDGARDEIREHRALKWRDGGTSTRTEKLAVEEPLEIRLGGRRFTLTMRTPGHDEDLAAGFLFAEGFINSASELGEIRRVKDRKGAPEPNAIDIILNVPADGLRQRLKRNFVISSSCGVCGKTSIDSILRRLEPLKHRATAVSIAAATLLKLAPQMRDAQTVFAATGGIHAAGLFDLNGTLSTLREDVGRHNAVDKVVGNALMKEMIPLANFVMMVSGRLSFEIVQKAAAAGVLILAAVSAPSSLAVELAAETETTLVGFLRDGSFNVYTRPDRIAS
ncbi:MAG TPA: formate dehydrogenase accessory sulfurtransferase FdhD [Candidatus Binataceae bacterium]